jgi:hypothetical protein
LASDAHLTPESPHSLNAKHGAPEVYEPLCTRENRAPLAASANDLVAKNHACIVVHTFLSALPIATCWIPRTRKGRGVELALKGRQWLPTSLLCSFHMVAVQAHLGYMQSGVGHRRTTGPLPDLEPEQARHEGGTSPSSEGKTYRSGFFFAEAPSDSTIWPMPAWRVDWAVGEPPVPGKGPIFHK